MVAPVHPSILEVSVISMALEIFNPSNRKFVDLEGSATEYLYGIGAIVLGAVLVIASLKKMGVF